MPCLYFVLDKLPQSPFPAYDAAPFFGLNESRHTDLTIYRCVLIQILDVQYKSYQYGVLSRNLFCQAMLVCNKEKFG